MPTNSGIYTVPSSASGTAYACAQAPPNPQRRQMYQGTGDLSAQASAAPVAQARAVVDVNNPVQGQTTLIASADASGSGIASAYAQKGYYRESASDGSLLTLTIQEISLNGPDGEPWLGRYELRVTALATNRFDRRILRPGDGIAPEDLTEGARPLIPTVPSAGALLYALTVEKPTAHAPLIVNDNAGFAERSATIDERSFVQTDGGYTLREPVEVTITSERFANTRRPYVLQVIAVDRLAPGEADR